MYLEIKSFKLAYKCYNLETTSHAMETGGGGGRAGPREEGGPGRPVQAHTDSLVYIAVQLKSQ